jgi:hypothetical protein
MRMPSASSMTGRGKKRQQLPRPGTKIREVYDLLVDNAGECVTIDPRIISVSTPQLTDFYGLDIRRVRNGNKRTGTKSVYILVGMWNGRDYTDFSRHIFDSINEK